MSPKCLIYRKRLLSLIRERCRDEHRGVRDPRDDSGVADAGRGLDCDPRGRSGLPYPTVPDDRRGSCLAAGRLAAGRQNGALAFEAG